jgi:hypothetical protein
MGRRRGRLGRTTRRLFLVGVIVAVAVAYVGPVRGYLHQRSELAGYRTALTGLESKRDRLARQIAAIDQPAVLEVRARELDLIRPGERRYVLRGLAPPPRPVPRRDDGGLWNRFLDLFG